jgi:hypothetical protein
MNVATVTVSGMLMPGTAVGISVGMERWTFRGYSALSFWRADLGYCHTSERVRIGLKVRIVEDEIRSGGSEASAGMSVVPLSLLEIQGEILQRLGRPFELRGGAIIRPHPSVRILLGWSETPHQIGIGVSVIYGPVEVEYGTKWHPQLEWTHGYAVSMAL